MNNAILQTVGLCKNFGNNEVIKNLNMSVAKGEIYGFLGVNGAGKTTVFKLLTGLLNPSLGAIDFYRKDLSNYKSGHLRNIGALIEVPIFYEHLSGKENLEIHLSYMDKENESIESFLRLVGLKSAGDTPVSQYSLGMKQRLAIARAISHRPKLLILDEPLNGLDPAAIKEMREFFQTLVKEQDMTILFSSHILSEVHHIASKIGIIYGGSLVKEIEYSEIKKLGANDFENYVISLMNGGNDDE